METRLAHWKQEWTMPSGLHICGYSRAAYRTGFYIKNLDIMLDAGPQNFNKPTHIFITHAHLDHIADLPYTMIGDEGGNHVFNVYLPDECKGDYLDNFIKSPFEINAIEKIKTSDWYNAIGIKGKSTFRLNFKKAPYDVTTFDCDHSVPTVSYAFNAIKNKLKDEYRGLPGNEIGKLRKENVKVTYEVSEPQFVYVCDTTTKVLEDNPFILDYPIVIIECTFLEPDHKDQADVTKHIHWNDLKPYVMKHKDIIFMLIHFSLRYKDEDIDAFFKKEMEENNIHNLKVWV